MKSEKKRKLYTAAILIYAVIIMGTFGAYECGNMTFGWMAWQIVILIAGILWFWNLIRIEDTRAARRFKR